MNLEKSYHCKYTYIVYMYLDLMFHRIEASSENAFGWVVSRLVVIQHGIQQPFSYKVP